MLEVNVLSVMDLVSDSIKLSVELLQQVLVTGLDNRFFLDYCWRLNLLLFLSQSILPLFEHFGGIPVDLGFELGLRFIFFGLRLGSPLCTY